MVRESSNYGCIDGPWFLNLRGSIYQHNQDGTEYSFPFLNPESFRACHIKLLIVYNFVLYLTEGGAADEFVTNDCIFASSGDFALGTAAGK